MQDEGLFGVARQTKVDRKRAGTRFVVPAVGFKVQDWLQVGWELFLDQDFPERDFWIQELNTREAFIDRPPCILSEVSEVDAVLCRMRGREPEPRHGLPCTHH